MFRVDLVLAFALTSWALELRGPSLGVKHASSNSQAPAAIPHAFNRSNHGWMKYHQPVRESWDEAIDSLLKRRPLVRLGNSFHDAWIRALHDQVGKNFSGVSSSPEVGMFDSGIGGLSVYKELKEQFPEISVAFLGDLEEPGYSKISSARVAELSRDTVSWLQRARGVGMTLVTCNIASNAMVQHSILSEDTFNNHPVIPITPPYDEFFNARGKKYPHRRAVGIFASDSMCLSGSMQSSIRAATGFHIVPNTVDFEGQAHTTDCIGCRECHMAVDRMHPWEDGPDAAEVELMLRKKFKSYLDKDNKPLIDYLVFGCTHFPILAKALFQIFGNRVMFVDPAVYQVKVASRWLNSQNGKPRSLGHGVRDEFYAGLGRGEDHKYAQIKKIVDETLVLDNSTASSPIVVKASCADRMGRAGVCPMSTTEASTTTFNHRCPVSALRMPDTDRQRLLSLSFKHTGAGFCERW